MCYDFFFQAEAGIRALVRSRGLGDVYKGHRGTRTNCLMSLRKEMNPSRASMVEQASDCPSPD